MQTRLFNSYITLVTLKIRLRSPKSYHLSRSIHWLFVPVWFKSVHWLRRVQTLFFINLYDPSGLEIRPRSPKSSHLLRSSKYVSAPVLLKSGHWFVDNAFIKLYDLMALEIRSITLKSNHFLSLFVSFLVLQLSHRGKDLAPKVIKLFSYSTQLSTKLILLINVKMPTSVGVLTFISMINTTSERRKKLLYLSVF